MGFVLWRSISLTAQDRRVACCRRAIEGAARGPGRANRVVRCNANHQDEADSVAPAARLVMRGLADEQPGPSPDQPVSTAPKHSNSQRYEEVAPHDPENDCDDADMGEDWVVDTSRKDHTIPAEDLEPHSMHDDDDDNDDDDDVGEDWLMDDEEVEPTEEEDGGNEEDQEPPETSYDVERIQLYIEQPTLVALAGFMSTGNVEEVVNLFERLPQELRSLAMEVLLQATVFLGFPRALAIGQALAAAELIPIDLVLEDSQAAENASKIGLEHFNSTHSGGVRKMRLKLESYHPDLHKWMLEFVHGRVMVREGLRMRDREIVAAVMCMGQDTAPVLAAHIRSARRLGASRQDILDIIDQCEEYYGRERAQLTHGLYGLMEKNFNMSV